MTARISHPLGRRLAAIASVVAVIVAVGTLLTTLITNPLATLLSVVALAALLTSTWVALTNRGDKRRVALLVGAAALVVLIVTVVRDDEHAYLVLTTLLALAIAVPAGRFALGREPAPPPGDVMVGPAERPALVVNPRSGDGRAAEAGLADAARSRGITVHELDGTHSVIDLVAQALADGADVVGVAGGDGSLAAAADQIAAHGADFVCLPAGTRNHFAQDLGLDRTDLIAGLDAFGAARRRRIDLARVNGHPFLNNVSMGLYGEIVQSDDYRTDKVGTALSRLPDLVGSDGAGVGLAYTDADGQLRTDSQVIHVSNNPYVLAGRGIGSRPSLRSGELGIVCLRIDGGLRAAEVLARTVIGSGNSDAMRAWTAPQFEVDSDAEVAVGLDGEALRLAPPLRFESEPASVPVRLPLSAPGESPGAHNHGYRWTAEELVTRAFQPRAKWRAMPAPVAPATPGTGRP